MKGRINPKNFQPRSIAFILPFILSPSVDKNAFALAPRPSRLRG
jgi:hypothetical protein